MRHRRPMVSGGFVAIPGPTVAANQYSLANNSVGLTNTQCDQVTAVARVGAAAAGDLLTIQRPTPSHS